MCCSRPTLRSFCAEQKGVAIHVSHYLEAPGVQEGGLEICSKRNKGLRFDVPACAGGIRKHNVRRSNVGRGSEAVTKLVSSAEADFVFPTSLSGTQVPGYLDFVAARLATDLSHRIGSPMSFVTASSGPPATLPKASKAILKSTAVHRARAAPRGGPEGRPYTYSLYASKRKARSQSPKPKAQSPKPAFLS